MGYCSIIKTIKRASAHPDLTGVQVVFDSQPDLKMNHPVPRLYGAPYPFRLRRMWYNAFEIKWYDRETSRRTWRLGRIQYANFLTHMYRYGTKFYIRQRGHFDWDPHTMDRVPPNTTWRQFSTWLLNCPGYNE